MNTDTDNDLNAWEWAVKHYGVTPFGIAWPKDTYNGTFLLIRIALIRMYVVGIYRPHIRPRMTSPRGR